MCIQNKFTYPSNFKSMFAQDMTSDLVAMSR